jgi:hypothetical protein
MCAYDIAHTVDVYRDMCYTSVAIGSHPTEWSFGQVNARDCMIDWCTRETAAVAVVLMLTAV